MDNATCSVDGCTRPLRIIKRRLCNTHYQADLRVKGKGRTKYVVECDGCGKEFDSTRPDGKLCSDECRATAYLGRVRVTRLPADHPVRDLIRAASAERSKTAAMNQRSTLRVALDAGDHEAVLLEIQRRSTATDDGCWIWPRVNKDGYPVYRTAGRTMLVHRMAVEAEHRAPLGKQAAHHICANTKCVNPAHLQPVTARDNTAEMLARTYMETRIADLESALALHDPDHPLLREIGIRLAA